VFSLNHHSAQQPERINHDVPLATRDLLSHIEALVVDRRLSFCTALALWPSIAASCG
jgi:hypothetical protein